MTWSATPMQRLYVRASPRRAPYAQPSERDFSGLTGALAWQWQPRGSWQVTARAVRDLGQDAYLERYGVDDTAAQALAQKSPLPTDEDSNHAMQADDMAGSVFQLSQGSDWFKALPAEQHALSSTSVLSIAPSERLQVQFEERPEMNLRRSFDEAAGVMERDQLVKASIDGKCHIHGYDAVQQTNMLSHAFVTCSCPR
jgi:hypothetical protein